MKNFRPFGVSASLLLILITGISFLPATNISDKTFKSNDVNISIKGTSSLHDWEMKSAEGKCDAVFVIGTNNKLSSLSRLAFTIPSKSLKSGRGVMDKNSYKALKTDEHKNIAFTLSSATVTQLEGLNYQIRCVGKLTIAGETKETELLASGKVNPADKSFTVSGTKKMKMTDYNVKPPTVMMGTIKTGNEISISYSLKLTQ
jgi:polyisoprenoid-binding protein YceI